MKAPDAAACARSPTRSATLRAIAASLSALSATAPPAKLLPEHDVTRQHYEIEQPLGRVRHAFERGTQATRRAHDDIELLQLPPIALLRETMVRNPDLGPGKAFGDGVGIA